jgi:asparagine synthase (glutamine-hydrolysing)
MCGISFYCTKKQHLIDELNQSLAVTSHRGPDANGVIYASIGDFSIGIGHNRLSILDLTETGSQPMTSETGNVISYNGEIYNHYELRKELQVLGYNFKGESDTEVILKLYDEYGSESFGMLRGMFSFVILDKNTNRLHIARDAVGIKPLYLYEGADGIIGSSEIKGLKTFPEVNTEIDSDDIYEFFNNGFLYEPSTGYKFIKKLMPGHCIEFDLTSGKIETKCYKTIDSFNDQTSLSKKLEKAIKNQQVADVPLGIFFSGGADSSILAGHFESTELFFAKYDSDPSADIDLKYSNLIAKYLGKELKVAELYSDNQDVESLLASVDFVARNTEELISDYTFWATYQLSKAARDNDYKVMLSGMGGDEAFAGYPRYLVLKHHKLVKFCSPLLSGLLKLGLFPAKLSKKFERLVSYSAENRWGIGYSRMLGYFSKNELTQLFNHNQNLESQFIRKIDLILARFKGDKKDKVKLAQFMDTTGFLSHNLMVSDKASMMASIELRVPLLDEAIVAHGLEMSSANLIHKKETKYPLKKILLDILPTSLVYRPKTGFNPPLDGLIEKIGKERLKLELNNVSSLLNSEQMMKTVDEHFMKKSNNTYKLWQLLYFSRWVHANFTNSTVA